MAEAPGQTYEEYQTEDEIKLQEYKDAFAARDAILESGIAKTFEKFLELGGDADEGMKALEKSYVGLPQMINVLIDWLHAAGYRKREIQVMVEEHLKSMVLRHFDPKKADLIFTEEGSTPSWLEEMISYPTWRELFYQLSEQYPDCLMLKFAIKLISDAGYQSEITSASTASHQPEVLSGLVSNSVTQIAGARPGDIAEQLKEFNQLVCHSQHTYFYAQAMLQYLEAGSAELKDFRRWLSQEMQREARSRKYEVTHMTLHFSGVSSHSRLFEALGAMLSRSALNPADISTLYRHYTEDDEQPPVCFLQIPQLLELLVQSLFKPGSSVNPDHKEKYVYILAYAVSVYEQDGEAYKDDLDTTKKAIETAHQICLMATVSHAELQVELPKLFECVRHPIVSMGVLRWVEYTLTDPTFFEVAAESTSLFLVLLDEIASCHQLQHPFILDLLKRLMEASYPTLEEHVQFELKRSLVDHLVHLFSCGHVLPVVDYVHKCTQSGTLDHSLVRHFVSDVFTIIQPPYSQDFISVFSPLVKNHEITGPLISSDGTDPVSTFLAEHSRKTKRKKKGKSLN